MNKEVEMKELVSVHKKHKASKEGDECVTMVNDFCKICDTKTVKIILERDNRIIAHCINCDNEEDIHININQYFKEYERKGGQR